MKESFTKFKGFKAYHIIHPDNAVKEGSAIIIKESILHHQKIGYQTTKIYDHGIIFPNETCYKERTLCRFSQMK